MNRRGFIGRTIAAIGALCGVTRGTKANAKLICEWNDRYYPKPGSLSRYNADTNTVTEYRT